MTVTVIVTKVTRLGHTVSGNPIKLLHTTDDGNYATAPDASCTFKIGDGWTGSALLTLDRWNRIIDIDTMGA